MQINVTRHRFDTPIVTGNELEALVEPYQSIIRAGFRSGMIQDAVIKLENGYTITFTKEAE